MTYVLHVWVSSGVAAQCARPESSSNHRVIMGAVLTYVAITVGGFPGAHQEPSRSAAAGLWSSVTGHSRPSRAGGALQIRERRQLED